MSVIHCTPDFYATLLVLFQKHRCELGLSDFFTKHFFAGKFTDGLEYSEEICEIIIRKMIVENSCCYCQRYPEHMPECLINDEKSAGDYLQYGKINKEYLKLAEEKPELLAQAINFWLYNTEESKTGSNVYKMILDTGKMPYIWGIPYPGEDIKIMPCLCKN
jgi:hypothetical protein